MSGKAEKASLVASGERLVDLIHDLDRVGDVLVSIADSIAHGRPVEVNGPVSGFEESLSVIVYALNALRSGS